MVVHDPDCALEELATYERGLGDYGELWIDHHDYPAVGALFSGPGGFLTFLRFEGDAGFTTRALSSSINDDPLVHFVLSNGQVDEYPTSWMYPKDTIFRALAQFIRTRTVPDC